MARVQYPYISEHDDELDLIEGDLITILCKDLEDKGWWKGEINGKTGLFPDNFVQLISQEEIVSVTLFSFREFGLNKLFLQKVKPPRPEKRPTIVQQTKATKRTSSILPKGNINVYPGFMIFSYLLSNLLTARECVCVYVVHVNV